jgi:hypothetical protein
MSRLFVVAIFLAATLPVMAQQTTMLDKDECAVALAALQVASGGPRIAAMTTTLQQRCVVIGHIEAGAIIEALKSDMTPAATALRAKLGRAGR